MQLAADENFNNDIVRGLIRRKPDVDVVCIQEVGLAGADDPAVLKWAAEQGRVVLSHDVSTLTKHASAASLQSVSAVRAGHSSFHLTL